MAHGSPGWKASGQSDPEGRWKADPDGEQKLDTTKGKSRQGNYLSPAVRLQTGEGVPDCLEEISAVEEKRPH
jgi:hypothetical protein